jgi:hypothetical protein
MYTPTGFLVGPPWLTFYIGRETTTPWTHLIISHGYFSPHISFAHRHRSIRIIQHKHPSYYIIAYMFQEGKVFKWSKAHHPGEPSLRHPSINMASILDAQAQVFAMVL